MGFLLGGLLGSRLGFLLCLGAASGSLFRLLFGPWGPLWSGVPRAPIRISMLRGTLGIGGHFRRDHEYARPSARVRSNFLRARVKFSRARPGVFRFVPAVGRDEPEYYWQGMREFHTGPREIPTGPGRVYSGSRTLGAPPSPASNPNNSRLRSQR